MNITKTLLTTALLLTVCICQAKVDYNKDAKYQELRDSMTHGFNSGDSARFYTHVHTLQRCLLHQKDYHGYYTQRCNEIIFEMNL